MPLTDQELLARTPADPDAFAAFYDRHEAPLLSFLRRTTGSADLAADVAAEVFAALLHAVGSGTEIEEPRGWLYAVARRKVLDGVRRGRVDDTVRRALAMEPLVLRDAALERIDGLADDESARARAALDALPDEQRAAVQALVLDDLTYEEIAKRLQCSQAVVRKRVSRGLAGLRKRLTEEPT